MCRQQIVYCRANKQYITYGKNRFNIQISYGHLDGYKHKDTAKVSHILFVLQNNSYHKQTLLDRWVKLLCRNNKQQFFFKLLYNIYIYLYYTIIV